MQEFNHKKAFHQIFYSKTIFVVGCFLALFFLYGVIGLIDKSEEVKKNKDMLLRERASLEEHQQQLEANLARLKTDQGVEEAIREKFPVVKEGEGMVVIVDQAPVVSDEKVPSTTEKFVSFMKRLFNIKNKE